MAIINIEVHMLYWTHLDCWLLSFLVAEAAFWGFNMHAYLAVLFGTMFGCSLPTSEDTSAPVTDPKTYPVLEQLDQAITSIMTEDGIPGIAACIIQEGTVAWCNGYGHANIETERAATFHTPFMLASVSKTITGVALMHLVEKGSIGLDDSIQDYLTFDVNHPIDDRYITPRMLLSHTSGIDDNWSVMNSVIVEGDSPITLSEFLEGYLTSEGQWYDSERNFLDSGLEGQTHYSNIGVALAGLLIEPVSGITFSEYCQTHIFEPLGMKNTSWFLSGLNEDDVAVPYIRTDDGLEGLSHYGYPDYPDGALRTGAEPLATFLAMFVNGGTYDGIEILSPQGVTEMKRIQYPQLDGTQGLIWYSRDIDGIRYFGHGGSDRGVSTRIGFRDDGMGFVILMNSAEVDGTLGRIEYALIDFAREL